MENIYDNTEFKWLTDYELSRESLEQETGVKLTDKQYHLVLMWVDEYYSDEDDPEFDEFVGILNLAKKYVSDIDRIEQDYDLWQSKIA